MVVNKSTPIKINQYTLIIIILLLLLRFFVFGDFSHDSSGY